LQLLRATVSVIAEAGVTGFEDPSGFGSLELGGLRDPFGEDRHKRSIGMFVDPCLHIREGGRGVGAVAGHRGRAVAESDFLLRRGRDMLVVFAVAPRVVVLAVEVGIGSWLFSLSNSWLAGPVSYRRGVDDQAFGQLPQPPQEPQSRLFPRALLRRLLLSGVWL